MRISSVSIFIAGLLGACSSDNTLGDAGRDARAKADGAVTDDGVPRPQDIVIRTPGVPNDVETRFMRPGVSDPTRSAAIHYPLDQLLFPRNVYAPDVQWSGPSVAGDLYRVPFLGAPVTVTAYVANSGAAFKGRLSRRYRRVELVERECRRPRSRSPWIASTRFAIK